LGGDDFDRRIVDAFIARFYEEHGADLTRSPAALHRLRTRARDMRHRYASGRPPEATSIPNVAEVESRQTSLEHPPIESALLEERWRDELDAIWPACVRLFANLGLGTEDVDGLYVVGGAAKLPPVTAVLEELFRRPAVHPATAELLPARGAAD